MRVVFFNTYSVLLVFVSFLVSTYNNQWIAEEEQAFRLARCIARCQDNKICRQKCVESLGKRIDELHSEDKGSTFSGAANFNATLHCKDTDVIKLKHNPGTWVIEQSTAREDASTIRVSEEEITSFTNLSAGTLYRYRAYRVTSTGDISEPETSPWFSTFEIDHQSEEIKDLELAVQELDDANPSRVRADIIFQPGSDRSCHYDVVSWNEEDGLTIGNFDSSHDFHFSLRNLDYEMNVTVLVSARNIGSSQGSGNASLTFVTPSCLQLHRNLTLCAPDRVEGLRISETHQNGSDYDIIVVWDEPSFIPENYTLQIQSPDYGNKEYDFITLPGNTTQALLTVESGDNDHRQRIISIIAESIGGTSSPVSIHISLDEEASNMLSVARATESEEPVTNSTFDDGIIAVPLVAIVAIVLGGAYAYHLRRHTKCKGKDKKRYGYCRNLKGGKKNLDSTFYGVGKIGGLEFEKQEPLVPKDRFEMRRGQLTMRTVLGNGAFGIVRLGSFRITQDRAIDVAVKMLKDNPSADDLKNFQHEISLMKSAGHHQNIVSMIGCCTVDVARPMLIVEYCSRGDLQTYLRTIWQEAISRAFERRAQCKIAMQDSDAMKSNEYENTVNVRSSEAQQLAITNRLYEIQEAYTLDTAEEQITVGELLNFARQVASGMEFLSSNRIIHRDLAARNVLLCEDKTVKISDFGLSRDIYEENVYKKQGNSRLPLKWMAIEALTHQIYTTQSDVWSFGILLWEIVTLGCNPYPETPTNMVLQLLKSGYRMEKPENCGKELYDIMLSCWRSTPHSRPNFTQLKHQLDNLLRTVNDNEYLNLYELIREPSSRDSSKLTNKSYTNLCSA